jgi:hypothetical protein
VVKTVRESVNFVDADFRLLCAAMWHREVQPRQRRDEQRCPRSRGCRDVCLSYKSIRRVFLKYVEKPFATAHVQPLARRVVKEIVSVADDVEGGGLCARGRVVNQDSGRSSTSDEESMVRLVEGHREVCSRTNGRPGRDHPHRRSIDNGDLIGIGHIHEDARP